MIDRISWRDSGGMRIVELAGELDHAAVMELDDRFHEAITTDVDGDIVVGLGGVTFLSSMGIGLLIKAHQTLAARGRRLKLTGLRPGTRDLLDSIRLLDVFEEI